MISDHAGPPSLSLAIGLTYGWCLLAVACADQQQASPVVTLAIKQYCHVGCDPGGIRRWGRGHCDNGEPNYAEDGSDPEYCGGGEHDQWRPGGCERRFCNGAVGRCWLVIQSNCTATIKINNPSVELTQTKDGETFGMRSACWVGWEDEYGKVVLAEERPQVVPGEHTMWLYATAERQGLLDEFGNYAGTATISVVPSE